ncbi:unnamed protein product [Tilletia controversa]|nr:unnamed protein product [Tilletia controversa]
MAKATVQTRSVSLFACNVFVTALAVGFGIWIGTWSLLPPPQPTTSRQLKYTDHQGRVVGVVALGVVTLLWTLIETLALILYAVQMFYWKRPFDKLPLALERIFSGFALITLGAGILSKTPAIKPQWRIAYAVGWGASITLAVLSLIVHILWAKHCQKTTSYAFVQQQNEFAMAEESADQRAYDRLAAIRLQYSQAQDDQSRGNANIAR